MDKLFDNCILADKLTELPSSAGLVLFADSQDIPILLLTAANIRRTVKNKLTQQDEKTKRADLKSITAKIYYTVCPCKFRLALEHYKAVKKIFPSNYKDHETLVYPAFIKIDLSEKIPFFSVTKRPAFNEGEKILGPFSGQKAAAVFLSTLEDTFRLCRKSEFVNNPAQAASCPYLQMDACCGVCGGKVSPEDYRVIIKDAFEAGAKPEKTIERLGADMQTAAKELNFEQADEIKRKIEKLSTLKKQTYPHTNFSSIRTCSKSSAKISIQHSQTNRHSGKIGVGAYRWTGNLKKLKIVHIDKSAKIKPFDCVQGRPQDSKKKKQTYAVFAMNFFEIIDLGDFVIESIEKIAEAIETATAKLNIGRQESCDSVEILEQFAIVSYFLYRTKPSGLWINASGGFNREKLEESLKLKAQNSKPKLKS
jgi:hypothetical protein